MSSNVQPENEHRVGLFGLEREMGYTHEEFFRLLPKALGEYRYKIRDNYVLINFEQGSAQIWIGEQQERRFTELISFPILPVKFQFHDASQGDKRRLIERFDHVYLKGLA